ADRSGDDALRVAIRAAGSYSFLCAGSWDGCERLLDEALSIAGDDRGAGAGIIIGCPVSWAIMVKGLLRRERGDLDAGFRACDEALRIAAEHRDPETEGWIRGSKIMTRGLAGDLDAALALAHRNYELTERLGDVFSRTWALCYLGFARIYKQDFEGALTALEEARRVYRAAGGRGGEAQGWRGSLRAEALLGLDRVPEPLATAEEAFAGSHRDGVLWAHARAAPLPGRTRRATRAGGADPGPRTRSGRRPRGGGGLQGSGGNRQAGGDGNRARSRQGGSSGPHDGGGGARPPDPRQED